MKFGDRLKELRKAKGLTQDDVAKHLGVSRPNITQYEKNLYDPSMDTLQQLSKLLGCSISDLVDTSIIKPVRKIKIIGTASCGGADINHYQANGSANYNGEFYTDKLYCVVANGDSMSPEIEDGDEIICDPDAKVQNGDMVHYTIGNESAIKIFVKDEDAYIVQFVPYNQSDTFKTRTFRLDDDVEVKIAKVVAVNKLKFNNRHARLKLIGRA